jgi:DNA-binding MarR family transcriptional regulator
MERDGYIYREKSAEDLRLVKLHLTEKGTRIDRLNRERIEVLERRFADTVTPEEREQLIVLLEKVMDGYQNFVQTENGGLEKEREE